MPLDPSIILGSVKPVQPLDFMQTLAQVSNMRSQQDYRLQQQENLRSLQEERAIKIQERQEKLSGTDALNLAMQNGLNEDGTFNIDKIRASVVNSKYGHLWPDFEKRLNEGNETAARTMKLQSELEVARRDAFGSAAASVASQKDPAARMAALQLELAHLSKLKMLRQEDAADFIEHVARDPTQLDGYLERAITASPKQMDIRNAAPRPLVVGPEQSIYSPGGGTLIHQGVKKEPELGSFEDTLGRWAAARGINPKDPAQLPAETVMKLRDEYLKDPTALATALQTATLANLTSGGKYTRDQVERFGTISKEAEASPLVKAGDRVLTLDKAIEMIRKDPTNPTNQLAMTYALVQVQDTYQSATREGEIELVRQLASRLDQLKIDTAGLVSSNGKQIVPQSIALEMARTGEELAAAIKAGRDKKIRQYGAKARVQGVGEMWDAYQADIAKQEREASAAAAAKTDNTSAAGANVPPNVAEALKGAKRSQIHTLSDGSRWKVDAAGAISPAQ